MLSRSTVVGALVVAELVVAGLAVKAVAGDAPFGVPGLGANRIAVQSGLQRTFVTGVVPRVVIDVHDVDLIVQGANVPSVQVSETSHRRGWMAGEIPPVSAQQTLDGVRVATPADTAVHAFFGHYSRALHLTVPAGARVEVMSAGRTTASGLRAKLIAHVPQGRITITDHRGDVDVSTGQGYVVMSDVQGSDIAANTRDGRIYFTRVGAERIDASSGSGRIVGVDVRATNGALTTRDGRIVISFAANSDAAVSAHTADGRIEAAGLRTQFTDQTHQTVILGEGRGRFDLSTASGNIVLTQGANV